MVGVGVKSTAGADCVETFETVDCCEGTREAGVIAGRDGTGLLDHPGP